MKIYRQKIFVSAGLKRRVARETAKRNLKFLGKLGKLAGKRTLETGNLMALDKAQTATRIAKDVVGANKTTLQNMKEAARTLGGGNGATASKRLGVAANLALDLSPTTAIGRTTVEGIHEIAGKNGKEVVQGLSEFATNPAKTLGHKLGHLRQKGKGGKTLGGKWIGPGVNKWCLGLAPDSIVSSIGTQFEQYKGADNLKREVEALVNSKDGRRFARTYDRRIGRILNPVHDTVSTVLEKVPETIDRTEANVKEAIRRPRVKPQLVPVRTFSEKILELPWTKENISKFKSPNNMLRHAKTEGGVDGVILCMGDELVGYVAWKGNYLQALEVPDRFKRSGYGERLVKRAIESGVTKLSVRKGNSIAIKLYEKLGFKKDKELNPVMIEMKL